MSESRESSIDPGLKSVILAESYAPGAVVADVARNHGLQPNILYGWRNKARQLGISNASSEFVEVGVSDKVTASDEADI